AGSERRQPRVQCRHPRLLRQHRPREANKTRGAARLGPTGAQAGAALLEAGVMEDGRQVELISGTPQVGVISPLLANIYLHVLDATWERGYAIWARWCATRTIWS